MSSSLLLSKNLSLRSMHVACVSMSVLSTFNVQMCPVCSVVACPVCFAATERKARVSDSRTSMQRHHTVRKTRDLYISTFGTSVIIFSFTDLFPLPFFVLQLFMQ